MQTFLVRVWMPATAEAGDERARLRGLVEHVATRRGRAFQGESDLLEFIHGCLLARQEGPSAADELP
jgi:hypothetical protein